MFTKHIVRFSSLFLLAGLLFASAPNRAHAEWELCTPYEVMESSNRIHVRCTSTMSVGTAEILYIAISNASSAVAARFIAIANAALVSGKSFRVDLPTSSSTNVSGCAVDNCRTPAAFGIRD